MTIRLAVARTRSAVATTAVLLNGVCAALIALWPAESISSASSWMHGVDLQLIQATAPLRHAWVYNALHKVGRADEVLK